MIRSWLVLATTLAACGGGEPDARIVGTLFTNTCDWGGREWLGVERVQVELEYTPGALADRSLPKTVQNCSLETALFADEGRLDGGADVPGLNGDARWVAGPEDGALPKTRDGLWFTDIEPSTGTCQEVDEIGGAGVTLDEAGDFAGVTTPPPGSSGLVNIDGEREHDWGGTIAHGSAIPLSWTAEGWDESFVQIRQLGGGQVRQTLTCNTTGFTAFRIDNGIWDQLDDVGASSVEVYVGFQNLSEVSVKGETAQTITRMVHVLRGEE